MISSRTIYILHILYWILTIYLDSLFYPTFGTIGFVNSTVMISIFYINYFVFSKIVIKSTNPVRYVYWFVIFTIFNIVIFLLWIELRNYIFGLIDDWSVFENLLYVINLSFLSGMVSIGFRITYEHIKNIEKQKKLLLEKQNHFNNTIKSTINLDFIKDIVLCLKNRAEISPKSIHNEIVQFSNLIRYNLYENKSFVTITEELEIVDDFLQLLSISTKKISIVINKKIEMEENLIPKGLLINFLFKHYDYINTDFENEIDIQIVSITKNEVLITWKYKSNHFSIDFEQLLAFENANFSLKFEKQDSYKLLINAIEV